MESYDFSGYDSAASDCDSVAGRCDSAAARAALDVVANAGDQIAERVHTPRWYRVGLGLSMAVALVALGVSGGVGEVFLGHFNLPAGVFVFCVAVVPILLTTAANYTTGVCLIRYRSRPYGIYVGGLAVLLCAGLWVRYGLDVSWAMVVAGIGAFLLTLVMEPRIDAAACRKLRAVQ